MRGCREGESRKVIPGEMCPPPTVAALAEDEGREESGFVEEQFAVTGFLGRP